MKRFFMGVNNGRKMDVIRALRGGMFSIAIITIFFRQNGLTMQQIVALQSLFAVAVLALELPTGYFADRFGRKDSIVLGAVFSTIGYGVYGASSTFNGFLAGEMILALGCSFVSGADSAIIYESIDASDRAKKAIRREGGSASLCMCSEAVTSFIGGTFLSLVSLRLPIYFDALLAMCVIPVALSLHKEQQPERRHRESALGTMYRVLRYSLHEHSEIKWLILYSSVVSASTLTMVWFIQVYWVEANIPTFLFGALWAGLMLIGAFCAYHAHVTEQVLGRKRTLLALNLLPVIAYLLLSTQVAMWTAGFIILFYIVRGMNDPVMKSYINGLVSSHDRALILSAKNLIGRLLFALFGPVAGWVCDAYSLQAAMGVCGIFFALLGALSLLMLARHRAL